MSFFPRSFVAHDANTSFHPLFRLLDDFDQYSRSSGNGTKHHQRSSMKSFTPKFDVKEIGDVYELHGELPGIEQKDIEIEFTDAQTLTVKGHTERSYTAGTPPAGTLQGLASPATITSDAHKEHQPTVEDENAAQATPNTGASELAKQDEKPKEPEAKYWVSERSVGEFARSFTFPVRVDQDQVRASMKNGILSVIVPKSKKIEARKITIN
jgi:HSP20 family protein